MTSERILCLDISSKTGYASMLSTDSGIILEEYGTLDQIHEPEGKYPSNYVIWAYECFNEIYSIIKKYSPDVLVIEETVAGSKAVYTQKFLEWVHFLVAKFIKESNTRSVYFLTGAWRSEVEAKMTKEEKIRNSYWSKEKKNKKHNVIYDINGKRIGKITKKHVNVRRANEIFNLNLKVGQNDMADAMLMGLAYHKKFKMNKESKYLWEEKSLEDLLKTDLEKK